MQEIKCKNCGNPLEWEDTFRHDGNILEGYLHEYQLWSCSQCEQDFVVEQVVNFTDPQILSIKES